MFCVRAKVDMVGARSGEGEEEGRRKEEENAGTFSSKRRPTTTRWMGQNYTWQRTRLQNCMLEAISKRHPRSNMLGPPSLERGVHLGRRQRRRQGCSSVDPPPFPYLLDPS